MIPPFGHPAAFADLTAATTRPVDDGSSGAISTHWTSESSAVRDTDHASPNYELPFGRYDPP